MGNLSLNFHWSITAFRFLNLEASTRVKTIEMGNLNFRPLMSSHSLLEKKNLLLYIVT